MLRGDIWTPGPLRLEPERSGTRPTDPQGVWTGSRGPGPAESAVWAGSRGAGERSAVDPAPYAVLLLNQQQLGHLLQQGIRPVGARALPPANPFAAYTKRMRRARITIVALTVLIAGASAWAWMPLPLPGLPWTRAAAAPTIATGASFNLVVGAPRSARDAAELAGRLLGAGIPAFTHLVPDRHLQEVLVGPYVSLDEAEAQQRALAARGFGLARMHVDETLREKPRTGVRTDAPSHPGLVLVGAPGRLTLALEMRAEPRRVSAARVDATTLAVTIGPVDAPIEPQTWSAPEGAHLIRGVSLEEASSDAAPRYAVATLSVPEFARANTRIEGRRVYVDLTWPREAGAADPLVARRSPAVVPPAARPATATGLQVRESPAAGAQVAEGAAAAADLSSAGGRDSLLSVVARFERMLPFVQSAARTPSADVLQALAPMIDELDAALRTTTGSGDAAAARGLLLSAAAAARRATDVGFTGDRTAEANRAAGFFEAARALVSTPPA